VDEMDKKGSLSLQVVVIAALCLLVLIVLSVIFASRIGLFNSGLKHCDNICTESSQECEDAGYEIALYYGKCEDSSGNEITKNAYCCSQDNT